MSRSITPLLGAALLAAACSPKPAATGAETAAAGPISEVVQTKQGAVRGETVTDLVTAFIYRGIPYGGIL